MYAQLSISELETLENIAQDNKEISIPRIHLEKLSRLDLIEPVGCSVKLSLKGEEYLFNSKLF